MVVPFCWEVEWLINSLGPEAMLSRYHSIFRRIGCGAYSVSHWFQLKWPPQVEHLSIATKELFSVVISAALFGKLWSGHLVDFKVDNLAVVQVIQATYCKDSHLMHLIRLLVFLLLISISGFQPRILRGRWIHPFPEIITRCFFFRCQKQLRSQSKHPFNSQICWPRTSHGHAQLGWNSSTLFYGSSSPIIT